MSLNLLIYFIKSSPLLWLLAELQVLLFLLHGSILCKIRPPCHPMLGSILALGQCTRCKTGCIVIWKILEDISLRLRCRGQEYQWTCLRARQHFPSYHHTARKHAAYTSPGMVYWAPLMGKEAFSCRISPWVFWLSLVLGEPLQIGRASCRERVLMSV